MRAPHLLRPGLPFLTLLASVCLSAAEETARTFRFGREDAGKVPAGWKEARTGKGEGSVWKVVEDRTAPGKTGYALAQTASGPKALFNLCVAEDTSFKDGTVRVSFKAVKGEDDQGGGLVWRYQDANNYYVARMNPLEDNYRVYKVTGGKRVQLQSKEDVKIPAGEWHVLEVRTSGDRIECSLDGKKELDVRDMTFPKAGKVGLWTKADARTHFDNFTLSGD
jgi:hypothetical protein